MLTITKKKKIKIKSFQTNCLYLYNNIITLLLIILVLYNVFMDDYKTDTSTGELTALYKS